MTGPALVIDQRGNHCPLPVIALGRAAAVHSEGSQILLLADDPAAPADVAAWCRMKGATLVAELPSSDGLGGIGYLVELGPAHNAGAASSTVGR